MTVIVENIAAIKNKKWFAVNSLWQSDNQTVYLPFSKTLYPAELSTSQAVISDDEQSLRNNPTA